MIIRISIVLTLLFSSLLLAQSGGTLEVTSDPSGTSISLEGELRMSGVTPTVFNQALMGEYKLKAEREGYERYETKLYLTGGTPFSIDIRLSPKTRIKAFMRSAVIPGWGQYYSGEKTRGVFMGLSAFVAGITTLVSHLNYVSKREDYDDILEEYREERSIEIREMMVDEVEAQRKKTYDAESVRNISAGIFAAVWAYNLIDAVLFFPDKTYKSYAPRVSLDTGENFSKIGLAVNFRF